MGKRGRKQRKRKDERRGSERRRHRSSRGKRRRRGFRPVKRQARNPSGKAGVCIFL